MSTTSEVEENPDITVIERASEEAISLMEGEGLDISKAGIRLFVQQGGCAGLSYGIRFDREPEKFFVDYQIRHFQ